MNARHKPSQSVVHHSISQTPIQGWENIAIFDWDRS